MTRDQAVLLAIGGLALVCLILLVVVLRLHAGAARSRAQVEALRERLERLETQAAEPRGPRSQGQPPFSRPFSRPLVAGNRARRSSS